MGLGTIYKLSVFLKLTDMLSGPMKAAQLSINKTNERLEALKKTSKSLITTGTAVTAVGTTMMGAVLMPAKATFETKKALGELSSVGIKDLKALEKAGLDFSNKWSGTTKAQFISASYDIKSGISSLTDVGVAEYTRLSALTGKATKSTTAEMTSLFATGYGIYKDLYKNLSDQAFGQMFSGGIAASVQQFKTTGSGMSQAISTLGAAATTANRPLEEQLTILGMLQATMPGAEAGTRYRAFIQSAASAGEKLGLSFVDQNNQLLGMYDILNMLRRRYGDTLDAMEKQEITKAFGSQEAVQLIDLFYSKAGQLQNNISGIQSAMKGGTAATLEMATAMNIDPAARWERLGQRWQNLKEVMGNQVLPILEPLLDKVSNVVMKLIEMSEANPKAAKTMGLVISGLGLLLTISGGAAVGLGVLGYIFSTLGNSASKAYAFIKLVPNLFLTLRIRGLYALDALLKLRSGVILAAGGFKAFSLALLTNPITWIIVGIIALIAVIYLLWKNWDTVTKYFNIGKERVVEAIAGITDYISSKYNEFKTSGAALIQAFTDGIKSMVMEPYETVKGGLAKLRRLLPFSDAKEGPLSRLTYSGGALITTLASGIYSKQSTLYNAMASVLGGLDLTPALAGAAGFGDGTAGFGAPSPGLSRKSSFSFREIIREQSVSREQSIERRRSGPLVALNYYGGSREEADSLVRELEIFLNRNK